MNPSSPISQSSLNPILPIKGTSSNGFLYGGNLPQLIVPEGEEGSESYERGMDELFANLHRALWQRGHGHQIYDRNPLSNYAIFEGRLEGSNHDDILTANFAPGLQRLQDYSFFSANEAILNGMMQQAGLKFSMVSKGPKWEAQRREQVAQAGAEQTLRMMANVTSDQNKTDLSPALIDESIHVPQSPEEWSDKVSLQQQLESEITVRLRESNEQDNTEAKLLDCFRDKFIVNCEMAYVTSRNGQPAVEPLRLDQVSFWGKQDAKTAEDMDAWAIRHTLTLSQMIAKWGPMLEDTGDLSDIMEALSSSSGNSINNIMRRYRDGRLDELLNSDRPPLPIMGGASSIFNDTGMCVEQQLYVKLLQTYYVVLLTDVETDGSPCPVRELTKDEMGDMKKGRYPYFERVIYQKVTKSQFDELKKKKATSLRTLRVAVLYDSVRLGDRKVIYRRVSPWQEREPGRISTPKFPIVAHFGQDSSMVTRGRALHEAYTNVMISFRKKVALSGVKALAYDMTLMPKGYTEQRLIFEAKEGGFMFFNGQRSGGQPTKESYNHLKEIDLSMDKDLNDLLLLAMTLHDAYDRLCGITPGLKGMFQSRETQGQTQLGVSQGTMTTARHFFEHSQFVEEVLNRKVSQGKYVWPRSQQPRARGVNLDTIGAIPLHYYGVYLEDTMQAQKDKDFLMQMGTQAVSSGAASWGEIIQMYYADSPQEVLSILQNGLTAFEKVQAEQQQQSGQLAQMQAEINQAKIQIPLQVAQINQQTAVQVEQLRQGGLGQRNENDITFKENKSDIDTQANVQRDLIRNAGQQELAQQNQLPAPV